MITREAEGLIKITGQAGIFNGLWTRCVLRRPGITNCAWTGRQMVAGCVAYRPITNGIERMQRVSADFVERAIDA